MYLVEFLAGFLLLMENTLSDTIHVSTCQIFNLILMKQGNIPYNQIRKNWNLKGAGSQITKHHAPFQMFPIFMLEVVPALLFFINRKATPDNSTKGKRTLQSFMWKTYLWNPKYNVVSEANLAVRYHSLCCMLYEAAGKLCKWWLIPEHTNELAFQDRMRTFRGCSKTLSQGTSLSHGRLATWKVTPTGDWTRYLFLKK